MIQFYLRFERLSEEVRAIHKIRSMVRLDCTTFAGGNYTALDRFKNPKGQMVVYPSPCREVVKSNPKRRADICLTNGKNISSIFQDFSNLDFLKFGWGDFAGDCFLFIVNQDFTQIEILVLPNLGRFSESLFDKLLDGGFDEQIVSLRDQAKPYFNY